MIYLKIVFFTLFSFHLFSKDVTSEYQRLEKSKNILTEEEINFLKTQTIIFIPGILSEVFSWEDERGVFDFSFLSSEYFGAQIKHLKKLKLQTIKIKSSSYAISDTVKLIHENFEEVRKKNQKAIFITHSLGGLALLDYLIEMDTMNSKYISGIIFIQTPFYGSPMASVYLKNPYEASKWLSPILPFFNTSQETIDYLSLENRAVFMNENHQMIKKVLGKSAALILSTYSNSSPSIFKPAIDIMEMGCIKKIKKDKCLTPLLFEGPFDLSDGMVPLYSSKIDDIDSITLEGVDHGETIIKLPFQSFNKEKMTETLLKMLLKKL